MARPVPGSRCAQSPPSAPASASGVPSHFTLLWGCLREQLAPSPVVGAHAPLYLHGSIRTPSPSFNTESHGRFSLFPRKASFDGHFPGSWNGAWRLAALAPLGCSPGVWTGPGASIYPGWEVTGCKAGSSALQSREDTGVPILGSCQHGKSPAASLIWDVTRRGGATAPG